MTECTTGYLFSLHQSGGVTLTRMFIRDIKDAILAVCVILLAIGLYLMERKLNEVIDTHSYTTNATSVSMAAVDARIHNLTRANDHTDAGLMRLIKRQDASGKWSQQQPQCGKTRICCGKLFVLCKFVGTSLVLGGSGSLMKTGYPNWRIGSLGQTVCQLTPYLKKVRDCNWGSRRKTSPPPSRNLIRFLLTVLLYS